MIIVRRHREMIDRTTLRNFVGIMSTGADDGLYERNSIQEILHGNGVELKTVKQLN